MYLIKYNNKIIKIFSSCVLKTLYWTSHVMIIYDSLGQVLIDNKFRFSLLEKKSCALMSNSRLLWRQKIFKFEIILNSWHDCNITLTLQLNFKNNIHCLKEYLKMIKISNMYQNPCLSEQLSNNNFLNNNE